MVCNTWQKLELPGLLANDSRTKHSTVLDPEDSSLLVFGGFVGTLRADMLRLSHGNCSQWGSSDDCGEEGGPLCVWEEEKERCVPVSQSTINNSTYSCALSKFSSCTGGLGSNRDDGCRIGGWVVDQILYSRVFLRGCIFCEYRE